MTGRLLINIKSNIIRAGLSILLLLSMYENIASTTALSSNYVEIKGWVIKDNKPLANAEIVILENDSIVYQLKSGFSGGFSLIVPFQKEYIFAFSKKDLITKKVFIYTKTHSYIDPNNYYDFHFEVELFEDGPLINRDFFNYPVSMVFYDENIDEFNYFKANMDQLASGDKNIFRDLLEKDFQYPESFLNYVQSIMDEEKLRIEKSNQQPLVQHEQENDYATILNPEPESDINTDISVSNPIEIVTNKSVTSVSDAIMEDSIPESKNSLAINSSIIESQRTEEQNPPSSVDFHSSTTIDFKNYYNPENTPDFSNDVFFSIQILATKKKVPDCFFCKIQESLPEKEIYYYHDKDSLDKFIVGVYYDLNTTLQNFWPIRRLGYEAYVVAFHKKERIRVKEAQSLLHNLATHR
jgi:hypothetical protein